VAVRRLTAALAAALVLAACGSTPKGFLLPTAAPAAPGARHIDMLVVTTRAASPAPG